MQDTTIYFFFFFFFFLIKKGMERKFATSSTTKIPVALARISRMASIDPRNSQLAVSRRNSQTEESFEYNDLKVDFKGRVITIKEEEIKVTPKEFELLAYFINNKNIAISRETLLNKIWGYDFYGDYRTIDTHIKMLRNSLREYRDLIVTVRGMGYKLEIK